MDCLSVRADYINFIRADTNLFKELVNSISVELTENKVKAANIVYSSGFFMANFQDEVPDFRRNFIFSVIQNSQRNVCSPAFKSDESNIDSIHGCSGENTDNDTFGFI
jgi:hypothetical protein